VFSLETNLLNAKLNNSGNRTSKKKPN
jgi:hypothetical protein